MRKISLLGMVFGVLLFATQVLAEQTSYRHQFVVDVNGRGNFVSIKDAIDYVSASILATEKDPVLIKVMPGVYQEASLSFSQQYVDIEGAGKGLTRVNMLPNAAGAAMVIGANNVELRNFTLDSKFTGYNIGVLVAGTSALKNVDINLATIGVQTKGIEILWSGGFTMENVDINVLSLLSPTGDNGFDAGRAAGVYYWIHEATDIIRFSDVNVYVHGNEAFGMDFFSGYGPSSEQYAAMASGVVTIDNSNFSAVGLTTGTGIRLQSAQIDRFLGGLVYGNTYSIETVQQTFGSDFVNTLILGGMNVHYGSYEDLVFTDCVDGNGNPL